MTSLYTVLLLLPLTQSHPSECSYQDDKFGVKFNYYGLKISPGEQLNYYTVTDSVPNNPSDMYSYTYYFNLCSPVIDFPTPANTTDQNICLNPPYTSPNTFYTYCDPRYINTSSRPHTCAQEHQFRETINGRAYAYQLRSNSKLCYPLSSNEEASKAYSISLYDPIDPTQGLTIQYHNGAWSDVYGANRALRIHLKCDHYASSVPKQMDVTELFELPEVYCTYELTIKSIHACPIGCLSYANLLCASHGVCGYDFSTNRSRCFCFWGYSGSSCEQEIQVTKLTLPAPDRNPSDYSQTFSNRIEMTNPFTGNVQSVIVNTTYDLSAAYNPNSIYQINDTAQAYVGHRNDYIFYFSIGGTINSQKLPKACHKVAMPCKYQNYSKCMSDYTKNISVSDPAEIGFAFRYTNSTNSVDIDADECILLGTKMMKWDRYDPDDNAAHGVKITYKNGSFMPYISSPDPLKITNCEFTINLVCPKTRIEYFAPVDEFIIDQSEVIDLGSCKYEAAFETAFACPYNCITKNKNKNSFSVCSGNGICIADPSAGFMRCVCDEMYDSDCSIDTPTILHDQTKQNFHFLIIAITVACILVFGVIIVFVYWNRRRKNIMNQVISKEQVNTQESKEINEGITTERRKETYCELQDAETDDYC